MDGRVDSFTNNGNEQNGNNPTFKIQSQTTNNNNGKEKWGSNGCSDPIKFVTTTTKWLDWIQKRHRFFTVTISYSFYRHHCWLARCHGGLAVGCIGVVAVTGTSNTTQSWELLLRCDLCSFCENALFVSVYLVIFA